MPTSVIPMVGHAKDDLVKRLQAGDERAIAELISTYSDRLLRVATLILGDQFLAEDLVYESLTEAVRYIHGFRQEASVYTWLYTILVRRCRKQQKKRSWNMLRFISDDEIRLVAAADPTTEQQVEKESQRYEVREAVKKLQPKYREVVALFYFEEFTIEEIAHMTQEPQGTIRSRMHRARNKLAELLRQEAEVDAQR